MYNKSRKASSERRPQRVRRPPQAEVKARLLAAAARVFAAQGYEAASIDAVAEAAGFSKGAVYSNFDSKEELFLALVTQQVDARLGAIEAALASGSTTPRRGAERAGQKLAAILEREGQWHVLFLEFWLFAMRHRTAHRRLAEHRARVRASIEALLEREQASRHGELPLPARRLAPILLALSNGLAIEHSIDPEAVSSSLFGDALGLLFR